ncbi:MAG: HEAT repeat domain-containing protein, partial [Rhodothermales bacterium]
IEAVSEATEKDVMGFADTWIYGGGHPVLDVRYSSGDNSLRLRVEQVQSGESVPDVFPLDLTVEIGMLDGAERFDVRMNDAVRTYDLSISGRPRYVAIDPDGDWLIEHNTDQSSSAWVAQLRYATAPHARRVAADNLGGAEAGNTLLLGLRAALDAESNAGVRAAIVEAIGRLPSGSASERVLIDTYGDPSPIVRRAVLRALADTMSSAAAARLALRAAETDVHYDLQAEAVRTYARIGPDNAIDVARSALVTPSHDDVIRAAGLDALGELRDRVPDVAREEGLRYASEGYPLRLRLAAVRLLGSLAPSSDVAVDRLADLLADRDPAVASSAVAALESAGFQERVFEHIDDIRAPSVQSYVRTSQACN